MNNFDPTNNISWQLGHRGRVAVFIDGNNLFHAARFHNIDIDYNKLLRVLLGDGRLLRAFFSWSFGSFRPVPRFLAMSVPP